MVLVVAAVAKESCLIGPCGKLTTNGKSSHEVSRFPNDNKPPSLTKFSKHLYRKLHSHLEWPDIGYGRNMVAYKCSQWTDEEVKQSST